MKTQKGKNPCRPRQLRARYSVITAFRSPYLRRGVAAVIGLAHGTILAEATNGRHAIQLARKRRPEIIIMDIELPELNGLEAARVILKAKDLHTKVILLTSLAEPHHIEHAVRIKVSGYLLLDSPIEELITAIKKVRAGSQYFGGYVERQVLLLSKELPDWGSERINPTGLSDLEKAILQLIAESYSGKAISQKMGISIKTVDSHRQRIMHKLQLHDISSLTRYAQRAQVTYE